MWYILRISDGSGQNLRESYKHSYVEQFLMNFVRPRYFVTNITSKGLDLTLTRQSQRNPQQMSGLHLYKYNLFFINFIIFIWF